MKKLTAPTKENKIMYISRNILRSLFIMVMLAFPVFAQIDSGIKKIISNNNVHQYYGGAPIDTGNSSGDARFLVMESNGNIATHNPRNSDGNWEIFLLDQAQRHIFQITDTKSALRTLTGSTTERENILVYIVNIRPDISNDGKYIVFTSNATTSISTSLPNNTNPGNFDGNASGNVQILQQDANTEVWLYQIPNYQPVDITTGDTPAFVNLSLGTFTQITNTPASRTPVGGTTTTSPIIATDNSDVTIDDNGETLAFISNRNPVGFNGSPDNNPEVFTYKRSLNTISQVTRTSRGPLATPILQYFPSLSGDGSRIVFSSSGTNPLPGMSGGSNPDFDQEVYIADLDETGSPAPLGLKRQITFTVPTNYYDLFTSLPRATRNISRDGRYVLLQSRVKLTSDNTNASEVATFLFDCSSDCQAVPSKFRQIGPRWDADPVLGSSAGRGTSPVVFTDYDTTLAPNSLVFQSKMNFRADGTTPALNSGEGLNPLSSRPPQIFAYSLSAPTPSYTRLTNSQNIAWGAATRLIPGNTKQRISFITLDSVDWNETNLFHMLAPSVIEEDTNFQFNFFTGASGLSINATPPAAQGLMPNMLGSVVYLSRLAPNAVGAATNISNSRQFVAPLQLKGVSVSIDGIAAPLTRVTGGQINFIVPPEVTPGSKSFVVNHNGIVMRGSLQIISSPQPDILTNLTDPVPAPGGRARVLNITNPNISTPEPFSVTTQTQNGILPTRLRIFVTGVQGVAANSVSIQIGNVTIPSSAILTNATATDYPGIFTFDFTLPQELASAGDVPIIISVFYNGQSIQSRLSNSPRIQINANQLPPDDIAVWRPGIGSNASTWYILNAQQQTVSYQFGAGNDTPITRDFDGDGKTDFCVYRASTGQWHIIKSSDSSYYTVTFGVSTTDIPAAADYDGDSKADIAVFRPSNGYWYILQSSNNTLTSQFFGANGDKPEAADFDGDGKADLAVWRSSMATFYVKQSIDGQTTGYSIGQGIDQPVIGDYDGDGKADYAVRRLSDSLWQIHNSSNNTLFNLQWGLGSDTAVQGNYSDGDVKTDIAVWRDGMWYIRKSTDGTMRTVQWGQAGDTPVPAPYLR